MKLPSDIYKTRVADVALRHKDVFGGEATRKLFQKHLGTSVLPKLTDMAAAPQALQQAFSADAEKQIAEHTRGLP